MPSAPTKVLITGMQGLIASAVLADLRREPARYEVHGMDQRPEPWDYEQRVAGRALPPDRFRMANPCDPDAVRHAVEGMDVVVHFGTAGAPDAGWDDELVDDFAATYHVLEASRLAGVRRVIYSSTAMVCGGYLGDEPYRAIRERRFDDLPAALPMINESFPARPSDPTAADKLRGEALGRVYADVHALSIICLRFGCVNDRDFPFDPELASIWCSQRDAVQLVRKSIDAADEIRFDVFFGISANVRRWVDFGHAAAVLGYAPRDRAEARLNSAKRAWDLPGNRVGRHVRGGAKRLETVV